MDRQQAKELIDTQNEARLDEMERQYQKDEAWLDAMARQTAAVERTALALEKIATGLAFFVGCISQDNSIRVRNVGTK
jgi:hypothetical protein